MKFEVVVFMEVEDGVDILDTVDVGVDVEKAVETPAKYCAIAVSTDR